VRRATLIHREAIRFDPGVAGHHAGLGHALSRQKRYAGAEAAYREAIRLDPSVAGGSCRSASAHLDVAAFAGTSGRQATEALRRGCKTSRQSRAGRPW
jgi:cytochrome c-type biogenesis protein CcmH/NrfG